MKEDYYISGRKKKTDWERIKQSLITGENIDSWRTAFKEYFLPRLELRYLNPVKVLQDNGTFQGEGFAIMTILCSLIEFIEATCQGKIYKYARNEHDLKEYEYSSSKRMFISFLINREPFSNHFNDKTADIFYSTIRCGLLHEASTKDGWRIWAQSGNGEILNLKEKIVYRNEFETSIRSFIDHYETLITSDETYQRNFLTKWNSL